MLSKLWRKFHVSSLYRLSKKEKEKGKDEERNEREHLMQTKRVSAREITLS
jgi:hypothetical protein